MSPQNEKLAKSLEDKFKNEDKYLDETVKLLLSINNYGKKTFETKMNEDEPGDKKKFELEIKYFKEWFI